MPSPSDEALSGRPAVLSAQVNLFFRPAVLATDSRGRRLGRSGRLIGNVICLAGQNLAEHANIYAFRNLARGRQAGETTDRKHNAANVP